MKISKKITLAAFTLLPLLTTSQLNAATPANITSDGKDSRTDFIFSASMTNGAQNCGPGSNLVNNGWVVDTEAYFNHNGLGVSAVVPSQGGNFSAGVLTIPVDGFYQINVSARIERQSGDLTLKVNGTQIVAGFGTDLVERWENQQGQSNGPIGAYWTTLGVTKNLYLKKGNTVSLYHESGQSNDCIYATNFKYTQFNAFLIRATGGNG